jgi:hypothetical protein
MDNLEIFDKDGKALHIADVIYSFIKERAKSHNKDLEDVYVGIDDGHWNKHKSTSIYTVEVTDNSYDGKDVNSFGDEEKVYLAK